MTHDTINLRLTADAATATKTVSPTLFGLFYEDLNRSLDGGLNANMVANHSFEGVYLDRRLHNELIAMALKRRPRRVLDPTRHWHVRAGELEARTEAALREGGTYARLITTSSRARVENHGYQPDGPGPVPAIAARSDAATIFTAWVRADAFDGTMQVGIVADGEVIGAVDVALSTDAGWQRVEARVAPTRDARALLRLDLSGTGYVDIDDVSLIHADHWGAGDPKWSQGRFRRDLVEALRDLHPTFMRFPGGCVVEGIGDGNAYDWKKTVGPLHTRVPDFNLWALRTPDGDYSQSHQIGFYEYFLLCEDLGIAAMPVVSAGISCQFRSKQSLDTTGAEFAQLRQDIQDLIDWATGDPATNAWAALRAEAGHPEPFELRYIGLGNENHGEDYLDKFRILHRDVRERHPGIRVVLSAGPFARGAAFDQAWAYASGQQEPLIVDEHFYKPPQWFIDNADRYDAYPRGAATVFVGEYAAHPPTAGIGKQKDTGPNSFESALAEAAFLTGVVRNADVVEMTSYAPLFTRTGTQNWDHNLIEFSPDAVMPTLNYEVQRLFAAHLGDRIVPIQLDQQLPGLFACSTVGGDRQHVVLVNTTEAAVHATVVLPCASGDGASVLTLAGRRADANKLTFDGSPQRRITPEASTAPLRDRTVAPQLPPLSITVFTVDVE